MCSLIKLLENFYNRVGGPAQSIINLIYSSSTITVPGQFWVLREGSDRLGRLLVYLVEGYNQPGVLQLCIENQVQYKL